MDENDGHRIPRAVFRRFPDLAVFIVILLLGMVYTLNLDSILDIRLSDESHYLHRGMMIPQQIPSAEKSPGYSLWYRMLSFVQPDTARLYFLNYRLMTILPALAVFLTLRVFRVSRLIAFAASAVFLFSTSNILTWPKISHFTALVLLAGILLSGLMRNRILQISTLTGTALAASYIRPEFFVAYACLCVFLLLWTIGDYLKNRSVRVFVPLTVILALGLGLAFWLGVPVASGDRSMVAFGQHYALHWVKWTGAAEDPWTTWEVIIEKDFGSIHSPVQALSANPSAFLRHVLENLRVFPGKLLKLFFSSHPRCFRAYLILKLGIAVLALGGLPYLCGGGFRGLKRFLRENLTSTWLHLTLIGLLSLPVLISIILIYARLHYVYLFGLLSGVGAVMLLFRTVGNDKKGSTYIFTAVVATASLILVHPVADAVAANSQPVLKTVSFLRQLNLTEPVHILEAGGGLGLYVGRNYSGVSQTEKERPFTEFLSRHSINMVVVSPRLSHDVRFRDDPQWRRFVQNPGAFGFLKMDVPDVDHCTVLIAESLVGKDEPADPSNTAESAGGSPEAGLH